MNIKIYINETPVENFTQAELERNKEETNGDRHGCGGVETKRGQMLYYMKLGEEEERELERRQAKKIEAALTGKKTPPEAAVIKKLKEKAMGYYDTCAFPKPQSKKKKKKCNGYKDKADAHLHLYRAAICGAARDLLRKESADKYRLWLSN